MTTAVSASCRSPLLPSLQTLATVSLLTQVAADLPAGRGPTTGLRPFASLQGEEGAGAPKVEEADQEGPFGVHPQPQRCI